MPGEIATFLLGAQGGDEEAFARLYAATNPVLVRYLRSVGVEDAPGVALASWPTLLNRLPTCPADDDDWFELAVGTARETARSGGSPALGTTSTPADAAADETDLRVPAGDGVDRAVAALRGCGTDAADVLAMAVVAGLGRDSMARLTGEDPAAVLALVRRGQYRLTVPLEQLYAAMAAPARADEVADAAVAARLFRGDPGVGASPAILPTAAPAVTLTPVSVPALTEPSVDDLLTWRSPAAAPAPTVVRHLPRPGEASRGARAGAGAAAWVIALGGVGAAAAMSGLLPAVVDNLFRGPVNRPVVTAQGPVLPGPSASGDGGTSVAPPGAGPATPQTRPGSSTASQRGGTAGSTGGAVAPVSLSGSGGAGSVVVSAAVFTPATGGTSTPARGGGKPGTGSTKPSGPGPTGKPPTTGGGTVTGGSTVTGPGRGSVTTPAKAHGKAAKARARAAAARARAQARAAAAQARAQAKAAKAAAQARARAEKARAKAARTAQLRTANARAAQARAANAKVTAAKAKAGKAKAGRGKGKPGHCNIPRRA